jgi:OFA family oxalate/formate antiporter-like MFS transporter
MPSSPSSARWGVLLAATGFQLCTGAIYAWSFFQNPLVETYGWSHTQVSWCFSLCLCSLGITAAWGGTLLPKLGPQRLARIGGILFGLGYLIAATALFWKSLALLYLGYGVVGGIGIGLGYIPPVATVTRWFPDKKGLATSIVIMGFGFGNSLTGKLLAPWLYHVWHKDLALVFACLGIIFMTATALLATFLRNPPATSPAVTNAPPPSARDLRILAGLFGSTYVMLWTMFFLHSAAAYALITFQSPFLQDLWKGIDPRLTTDTLATYGATLIGISGLCNGVGRIIWGGLSDHIGRTATFRILLAIQVAIFFLFPLVGNPWLYGAMVCCILMCYGGGAGTMPSMVFDIFGAARMAVFYGAMLTASAAAGIVGPQLFAFFRDHCAAHARSYPFFTTAGMLSIALVFSLRLSDRAAG